MGVENPSSAPPPDRQVHTISEAEKLVQSAMREVSKTHGTVRLRGDSTILRLALDRSCGISPDDLPDIRGKREPDPIPVRGRSDLMVQAVRGEKGAGTEFLLFHAMPPVDSGLNTT